MPTDEDDPDKKNENKTQISKTDKKPKNEPTSPKQEKADKVVEQQVVKVMNVQEAKDFEFTFKGKNYKVGECSNEQLFWLRENAHDELKEAVEIVLTDKAFTGDIT